MSGPEENKLDSSAYNADTIVGNGSFGVVYRATKTETGEIVAIKKVFQDKRYKNRELQIMKELEHPNIISLIHAFYTNGDTQDDVYLNIVMDYIPETVYRLSRHYVKTKEPMPQVLAKVYSYQLFRSIAHMHALQFCHRDIKPQNLLVDTNRHIVKLCDLGSAKKLQQGEVNVSYICSRYYRAPELIFGAVNYTTAIDVWSAGCVLAELLLGRVLFPGESGTDQLVEIMKLLGTPTRNEVLEMNPNFSEYKFPFVKAQPLRNLFGQNVEPEGIDLVLSILKYNPQQRPTALEVLAHPFFDELRTQGTRLPNDVELPELFNWTRQETAYGGPALIQRLTPDWYSR